MNDQPTSIHDWLIQQSAGDIPLHRIARALGVSPQKIEELLQATPTAEGLLNLNWLAQYRHLSTSKRILSDILGRGAACCARLRPAFSIWMYLALANRVWPNCTWLEWENRDNDPPVIDLIRCDFGRELLDYVERTFGKAVVLQYWTDLEVPSEYDNITLDGDDPLDSVPDDQIVDNPDLDVEEEVGEMFVFGNAATAACFRWLLENRHNYLHFVDNRTSYTKIRLECSWPTTCDGR